MFTSYKTAKHTTVAKIVDDSWLYTQVPILPFSLLEQIFVSFPVFLFSWLFWSSTLEYFLHEKIRQRLNMYNNSQNYLDLHAKIQPILVQKFCWAVFGCCWAYAIHHDDLTIIHAFVDEDILQRMWLSMTELWRSQWHKVKSGAGATFQLLARIR